MNIWKRGDWQIEAAAELVEEKLIPLIKKNMKVGGKGLLVGMSRANMADIINKHYLDAIKDALVYIPEASIEFGRKHYKIG